MRLLARPCLEVYWDGDDFELLLHIGSGGPRNSPRLGPNFGGQISKAIAYGIVDMTIYIYRHVYKKQKLSSKVCKFREILKLYN